MVFNQPMLWPPVLLLCPKKSASVKKSKCKQRIEAVFVEADGANYTILGLPSACQHLLLLPKHSTLQMVRRKTDHIFMHSP